ncbi:hypothetical protein [Conexibacter sp. CPCC 206217]|uniref:hypothetical protein n=1 Tax=Conexibacter sp. CPCC 206217 TaxID=3064574 RepID=UPI00271C28EF|nr:hypothetical protein [Conexibacter sp. CPCC 206217]MDO8209844.1 hypothetical protein [Conexibacter sp. CPCC 206217]
MSIATTPKQQVTHVTVSDSKFFIGLVGMINSLRMTGNDEPLIVIDVGLTDKQKALISRECEIVPPPIPKDRVFVVLLKASLHLLGIRGIATLLDSDVIITRKMTPILDDAAAGKLVVVADQFLERYFDEWGPVLGLDPPPRRQRQVGGGFLAIDLEQWPDFMPRWFELCERIPAERNDLPFDLPRDEFLKNPFALNEQDVLNAFMASELTEDDRKVYELDVFPGPPHNDRLKILDRTTLRCDYEGHNPFLLHYWNHPKPWLPGARKTLQMDAYVELLARVLDADDVPIPLPRAELPIWLRDDTVGRLVRRSPRQLRRTIRAGLSKLPDGYEQRARDLGGSVAEKLRLG